MSDYNYQQNQGYNGAQNGYCPSCGNQIDANAAFCPSCGCQLQGANVGGQQPYTQQQYAPPPYGQQQYAQPSYGQPPYAPQPVIVNNNVYYGNPKDKWIAFVLCFFIGYLGIHKFYEGKIGMGILYIFTGGLFGIGWLVDWIVILTKPNPYYV